MEENMRPKLAVGKVLLQVPVSRRLVAVGTTNLNDWKNYFKQIAEQVPDDDMPEEVRQDYERCYYAIENALHYGGTLELLQGKGENLVEMFLVFYDMYRFKLYLNAMV